MEIVNKYEIRLIIQLLFVTLQCQKTITINKGGNL